jgi:hypothetical protein
VNTKDAFKGTMSIGEMVLKTYVSDLSDKDLLTRPAPGANTLAWQLGHLIHSENQLVNSVCPGASAELPADFVRAHGREAAGSDDAAGCLPKDRYLRMFDEQRQATLKALDQLPDAELDRPAPKHLERICPNVGGVFTLVGTHVMMHAGQFATARRLLGKPVLI